MIPLPELLLSLSPAALRALLAAFGPVPGLPPKATHLELAQALFSAALPYHASPPPGSARTPRGAASFPLKLATFVWTTLPRYCTPSGRLALVEAARAVGDPRALEWLAAPAADVGAYLAIEVATAKGAALRRVKLLFALASLRMDRDLPERPTYELVADSPVPRDPKRVLVLLRRELGKALLHHWHGTEPDGTLRLALFLRQPALNRVLLDPRAPEGIGCRSDVPIAVDQVRIFPTGERVAFTLAMPELLRSLATALSLSLRPSASLRRLQQLTPADLAALKPPRVGGIEGVAARQRQHNMDRVERRGPGALDPKHRGSGGGYLDRATLRAKVDESQKVDAFIQLPHRIDVSHREFEAPMRGALEAMGCFNPGALPDDGRSLEPYEHGGWRWVVVIGVHFERMKKQGRFVRVASAHVVSEEYRMHGAGYVVREVPGAPEMLYALAEDRSLGARLVSAKDRIAWRLDLDVLAQSMRADIGAVPADAPLVILGVLDLGIVTLPSGRLRVVYPMGEPPPGWLEVLRRACGLGVTPVIFVPRGHSAGAQGVLEIELDVLEQLGAKRIGRALGRVAEALGVPNEVQAWRLYDEEVIVDLAREEVWVLGVRVVLRDRAWGLVVQLAQAGGAVVSTKVLGGRLSSAGAPDVTARKAKTEAERRVREALEGAGGDAEIAGRMIVTEGRKGYRLGVTGRVI